MESGVFSNLIWATYICDQICYEMPPHSLHRTASRIRLAFIRTVRRRESKTFWFKVALVILKFWLRTVSLKPFTSASHTLHTRLGAEAAAVAPQRARTAVYLSPSLHSSAAVRVRQRSPASTAHKLAHADVHVTGYFRTQRAVCDIVALLCGSHQGCEQFTLGFKAIVGTATFRNTRS